MDLFRTHLLLGLPTSLVPLDSHISSVFLDFPLNQGTRLRKTFKLQRLVVTLPIKDGFRWLSKLFILLLNSSYYLQYPHIDISRNSKIFSHPLQFNRNTTDRVIGRWGKDIWYTTRRVVVGRTSSGSSVEYCF